MVKLPTDIARRELLLGGLSAGLLLAAPLRAQAAAACNLTPELTEGPFYLDTGRLRRDITEGLPGVPLRLRITLLDLDGCKPLQGAAVDIWHCDAQGRYSGYGGQAGPPPHPPGGTPPPFAPGLPPSGVLGHPPKPRPSNAQTFLRGLQLTDAAGLAQFDTIYPGWYAGRAVHIHLKVHAGGHVCHTGQIAFPEDACAAVAQVEPYARHQVPRTPAAQDGVFGGSAAAAMLKLAPLGKSAAGYTGEIAFCVAPATVPAVF
jgi:protocatechuate 3,4-dioxygenase beta subunit